MCGITGIYSTNPIENIEKRIRKMNDSIFHRGPDFGDIYLDNKKVALGHRRLSIIDPRIVSHQPMSSNNEEWQLVFNGEIYNFNEIKEEIDYSFKTNSDTEIILAAVQENGIDWLLSKANGMFSIALYNTQKEELYLLRDRLGIKPLYYFNNSEFTLFSSEIKGILNSGLINAYFNESAVDEYLANRYIRAPYTFFENIYQLLPGTYLTIKKDQTIIEKQYWDIPKEFNNSIDYDEKELVKSFDKELNKAIKYRLISDVPLGTYLSGGVDSSIITAITAMNNTEKINTYTIGFEELNEFEYAQQIAEKYDTNHHELLIKKEDYFSSWERLIKFKDAPLGVPNEIPLALMSSKLKEKITVVLSGEGADELLGGYGKIFRLPFDYENSDSKKSFYESFIEKYEYVPRQMRDNLINTPTNYREEFDEINLKRFESKTNENIVFDFFHNYHVKGLLQRVDTTTMQTSVEARVPFLDHNLIEFSYKHIPYNLKLKWNSETDKEKAKKQTSNTYSEVLDTPKYLLRKVAYNYLPRQIIERKKIGFPVPLSEWFGNLEKQALTLLKDSTWLKNGVLEDLIKKSKEQERAGQILWMFINIELFKKSYFNKNWIW